VNLDCAVHSNFHESFVASEVTPPSERATGLVFAAVALAVAVLWRNDPILSFAALGLAAVLALVSLMAPWLLKALNVLWFRFGLLLHRIMNPIVMFALFALVFVPAGAIMRCWHDPLRLRRKPEASTYWISREASEDATGSMRNQF
jgi:hypothetical protein